MPSPIRRHSGPPAAASLLLAALTAAAAGAQPQASAEPAPSPPRVQALRVREAIAIDGHLDERVWNENPPFELPVETRPVINGPAPVRTEAWLAYDSDRVYFAFRAHDPDPRAIRARFRDRDTAFPDDQVGVILDTFHDGRRAFEFFVNPLGIQSEVLEDDVTGGDDPTWDAIWDSAGRITDSGYVVEGAIPFSSLRFPRRAGEQVWGFNAVRFYPRDSTRRLALMPRDPGRNCILCQLAELHGIEGPEPGLDLELDPTVTSSSTEERSDLASRDYDVSDDETEGGLTVRWGLTPNVTFNATMNPDFSQVETDAQQLDVNTQFALFFPEKRPFFLEGQDLFDNVLDTVYTRNFADPRWGLKLTGKEDAHALGIIVAEDEVTNLLFPAADSSALGALDERSQGAVLRYRRDLPLVGSTLGMLMTSRRAGDYQNDLFGADSRLRLGTNHSLRFEAFGSSTRYPDELAEEFGQPRGHFDGHALRAAYDYTADRWAGYAWVQDVGRGFRADLGFVPQVDYTKGVAGLERIWRGDGDDFYNEVRVGGDVDEARDQYGELLEREIEVWWEYQGPLDSSATVLPGARKRRFRGIEFDETFLYLQGSVRPRPWLQTTLEAYAGDSIDFVNVRAGDTLQIDPGLSFELGRHVRLDVAHSFEMLDVQGGELFRANLTRLAFRYQFDRRTQLRLISQYLDVERDPALYLDPVEARTRQLAQQLLFSWKLNPQTVIFAGYSDLSLGDASLDLTRASRTLFLKLGYAWLP